MRVLILLRIKVDIMKAGNLRAGGEPMADLNVEKVVGPFNSDDAMLNYITDNVPGKDCEWHEGTMVPP